VYDLQEPFRWIADVAVVEAFESGALDLPDFHFTGDDYRYRKNFPAKMIEIITGRPTRVEIPAKIARRVQDLAIAETPFSTGFRVHKQLRSLVQAHALYRGDTKITMEDFEEIRRLSKFMNLDFHQI
jgi:hypothetical protein